MRYALDAGRNDQRGKDYFAVAEELLIKLSKSQTTRQGPPTDLSEEQRWELLRAGWIYTCAVQCSAVAAWICHSGVSLILLVVCCVYVIVIIRRLGLCVSDIECGKWCLQVLNRCAQVRLQLKEERYLPQCRAFIDLLYFVLKVMR